MTDLHLAPEVEQLRGVVRTFARDRLAPGAEASERDRSIPESILRALDELGILAPMDVDADNTLDPVAITVFAEELGAGDPAVAYEVMCGAHAALAVSQLGSGAQRNSVLEQIPASAAPLGSLWFYEGFGRGPDEYLTDVMEADDGLILNGRKIAVVRPGTADFTVVIGRSSGRTTAVLLGPEQLGQCTITRDDRDRGKLALRAAHTGDVALHAVRARPDSALTSGSDIAVDRLVASARLSTAAIAVGCGTAAVGYAAEYATTRHAFGQPISSYQGVAFPLAEADMDLKGARAAILDVASRLADAVDPTALARETSQAVAAAMTAAHSATVTALNTLGGHGYLADYPVERWYRSAGALAAIDCDPLMVN
jgi:alkylation response protein AidB-like acyl-CoA dehydrogenase